MTLFIDNQKMDAMSLRQWEANFDVAYPKPEAEVKHGWLDNPDAQIAWDKASDAVYKAMHPDSVHFPDMVPLIHNFGVTARNLVKRKAEWSAWKEEMKERAELAFWLDPFSAMKLLEEGVVELWEHM